MATLTAKQVQFIKPADRRMEFPAGPPSGFYLVVNPSGAEVLGAALSLARRAAEADSRQAVPGHLARCSAR